jgi:hypothetical protein
MATRFADAYTAHVSDIEYVANGAVIDNLAYNHFSSLILHKVQGKGLSKTKSGLLLNAIVSIQN